MPREQHVPEGVPVSAAVGGDGRQIREAADLVEWLDERGVLARLLGGVAVVLHCESLAGRPHREIADIDLIVSRAAARELPAAIGARGYEPAERFNAMHGHSRMLFSGPHGKLDVFVEEFHLCHRLDLRSRLELESPTLTASDLLATKLQIVELNDKDLTDIWALLRDHEIGSGAGDHVDSDYLCSLVRDDWGLWRTFTGTLAAVSERSPEVADRADELRARMDAVEKSRRFRVRARIGERRRWYELPEDPAVGEHAPSGG